MWGYALSSEPFRENPPELVYYVALYRIFREFLDDISDDDVLPKEGTGFRKSAIGTSCMTSRRMPP
jgi:hypothetical protein